MQTPLSLSLFFSKVNFFLHLEQYNWLLLSKVKCSQKSSNFSNSLFCRILRQVLLFVNKI